MGRQSWGFKPHSFEVCWQMLLQLSRKRYWFESSEDSNLTLTHSAIQCSDNWAEKDGGSTLVRIETSLNSIFLCLSWAEKESGSTFVGIQTTLYSTLLSNALGTHKMIDQLREDSNLTPFSFAINSLFELSRKRFQSDSCEDSNLFLFNFALTELSRKW